VCEYMHIFIHNAVLLSHKEECNCAFICRKLDGTGDHHFKRNKTDSERQILHVFFNIQNLYLKKKWD
jgi:hypothetical protein